MFSQQEQAFLQTQMLARLATVESNGQPDADVVGFEFDGAHFYIGGYDVEETRKYKNVAAGQRLVSLVIDELQSINPWTPRGIKVHGTAEIVQREGRMGKGSYLAITPSISWSWGIEPPQFRPGKNFPVPRKVVWQKQPASQDISKPEEVF